MSNGHVAPTHIDQIEEALEERQTPDRRQQPSEGEKRSEERRKQNRRNKVVEA